VEKKIAKQPKRQARPHVRVPTVFNKEFEEELFTLWFNGIPLVKIHEKYVDTDKKFALPSLVKIKKINNWEKRRKNLELSIERATEQEIKSANKRKIRLLNNMLMAASTVIEKELKDFNDDPDAFIAANALEDGPLWVINKMQDLEKLFKMHDEIVNLKPSGKEVTPGDTFNFNQLNLGREVEILPQETQSKLLEIFSKSKDIEKDEP